MSVYSPVTRPRTVIKQRNSEEENLVRSKMTIAVVGVLLLVTAVPAWAHHAFAAEFDSNQPVKFKAVVTSMEWTNPHVWIHVNVKQEDGTVEKWAIEAGSPSALFRRGFTKQALLPGTEIVVDGYRAKDGSHRANGRDLTLPDGRTLFLGSSAPDAK
jgi:WD40 repeat protein